MKTTLDQKAMNFDGTSNFFSCKKVLYSVLSVSSVVPYLTPYVYVFQEQWVMDRRIRHPSSGWGTQSLNPRFYTKGFYS